MAFDASEIDQPYKDCITQLAEMQKEAFIKTDIFIASIKNECVAANPDCPIGMFPDFSQKDLAYIINFYQQIQINSNNPSAAEQVMTYIIQGIKDYTAFNISPINKKQQECQQIITQWAQTLAKNISEEAMSKSKEILKNALP